MDVITPEQGKYSPNQIDFDLEQVSIMLSDASCSRASVARKLGISESTLSNAITSNGIKVQRRKETHTTESLAEEVKSRLLLGHKAADINRDLGITRHLCQQISKSIGLSSTTKKKKFITIGELSSFAWSRIAYRCDTHNKKGLTCSLTQEQAWQKFVDQGGRCYYTGVSLTFTRCAAEQFNGSGTASADRANPKIGYTFHNLQWVHKIVNIMKSRLSHDHFMLWLHICGDYMSNYRDNQ